MEQQDGGGMAATRTEGGDTARRALRLVEAVAAASSPVALQDLADAVGLSKSTAYRLLRVLQEESYVTRADSGGYRIGTRLMGLAAEVMPRADVFAGARPMLRALADLSGETATLHLRAGDEAVLVLGAESDYELRRAAHIGSATPLYRGASGQAILAFLPADEVTAIVQRADEKTRPEEVERALSMVRADGYALSQAANHPGLLGVAVPILTTTRHVAASVAISGPADRWTARRAAAFAELLTERCARLALLFETSRPSATAS
ncbi:IclR family transcriptional regulator [Streptomyces sp. NPDC059479]|uniref:IclR family transcriptional regulator n=1 Tax=Streptomyces sp. NPDC059479 TaxID=3346848 RepID=UPI0036CA8ECC